MSQPAQTSLWFRADAAAKTVRQELETHAATVEKLHLPVGEFYKDSHFVGLELPRLRELTVPSFGYVDEECWGWLYALPALKRLSVGWTQIQDHMLQSLAAAPWWPRLTQFEIDMYRLEETTAWGDLWSRGPYAFRTLSLFYLNDRSLSQMIHAGLPDLEYLIVGSSFGPEFPNELATAALPSLEDLELRHTNVQPEPFRRFVAGPRPGLPKLKRIGRIFSSDRRVDYCDWNGAVVDWGYEALSGQEMFGTFLKGTSLTLLPENGTLETRRQSVGSAVPMLERVK